MKTSFASFLFVLASQATLPAAVTISVNMVVPNGSASGGNGSSGTSQLTTTLGSVSASTGGSPVVVTLPVTTYTVSNVNLTSLGGTASETFTFTVTYAGTTNGVTPGSPAYSAFGNIGVVDGLVSGTETLTATVALVSTSFPDLSLVGFTLARAGGVSTGESGTLSWTGGSFNVSPGNTIANSVTGTSFTLTAGGASTLNIEGFRAEFTAVPEPCATALFGLASFALVRRRRTV